VSAREALEAKLLNDQAKLASSGIAKIESYLCSDLVEQKSKLLQQAARDKAIDVLANAIAEVRLRIRALEMPLDELASKCRTFEEALASIGEQRRITGDILDGERRRLRDELEQRIESLRAEAKSQLTAAVAKKALGSLESQTLSETITAVFDPARQEFASSFAETVHSALAGHQRSITGLIDRVRRTAGNFSTPFETGFEPGCFTLGEEPYWVTEKIEATLLPRPSGLIDRLVPDHLRTRRRRARILRRIDELIVRNAENLRWAIVRGIDETFRSASHKFDEQLENAITTTNGVVQEALARRRTQTFTVRGELDRLRKKDDLLFKLRKAFSDESCGGTDMLKERENDG
jgi:hypothetical protein